MIYWYPQVANTGYRWNMLARIANTFNISPDQIGAGDTGGETYIELPRELTPVEKSSLDVIMTGPDPTLPPVEAVTHATILDVWTVKAQFEAMIGLPYHVYYAASAGPPSPVFDQIRLHFRKVLTGGEKNKVSSEYLKLISFD